MKIINPNVELIQQEPGFDGIMKHIERCGRTCYKSEDKITDDSTGTFVANLIKNKHYAMLEHGTVYLMIRRFLNPKDTSELSKYKHNPYSYYNELVFGDNSKGFYVTTNYRVLQENGWLDDLQYICEPTEFHTPRITLKFTTNIGVTREGNRMRANSVAEESTRYCNYTKTKFGNGELNIVPPAWLMDGDKDRLINLTKIEWLQAIMQIVESEDSEIGELKYTVDYYGAALMFCNICYNKLIERGWTPQQAREVLPLATKSEVVYTAFPDQWKHFFDLRLFGTTGKPHPNMEEIAKLAKKVLEENSLWNWIYTSYSDKYNKL